MPPAYSYLNIFSKKKKGSWKNFIPGASITRQTPDLISCKKEFVPYLVKTEE
jgi:hypothetical protein